MPTPLTKPVTRKTEANVPHGCRPELCVTIYPARGKEYATIGTRELGRAVRTEHRITIGELHRILIERAVLKCARLTKEYRKSMSLASARKQARKECGL